MRIASVVLAAGLLSFPGRVHAQADSAKADSAKADSAGIDSNRASKPAPKPAAAPTPVQNVTPRALAAGECPPAAARNDGDALRLFSSPTARGPSARTKPLLKDPTLRGPVTLAFEVDTLGLPDSTSVRLVDGDPYLLSTARSSVARWRYRPAELMPGCRVRARTLETVTFR